MRIPVVNEQDEIVKYIDSKDRQQGEICRVSALWITNEKNEVLLAQRSFKKQRDPGKWGPAVAGTVEEGETYEANITKEAQEEIGLTGVTFKPERKMRRSTSHEYFNQFFSASVNSSYTFVKQDSEVEEIRWFKKSEILKLFEQNPEIFVPTLGSTIAYFLNPPARETTS